MPLHPAIKDITFTPAEQVAPKPTLTEWDVKRSGPAQTVTGKVDGRPTKIAGVTRVKTAAGRVFALDGRGAVLAYLGVAETKTIRLTPDETKTLLLQGFDCERAADMTIEQARMLTRWCEGQSSGLFDDMPVQDALNVYRASWEWVSWEAWAEEDRASAVAAWNAAVIDPGQRLVRQGSDT